MKKTTAKEKETARVYHRFYVALQLRDLCNEVPVHQVAQKYDVPRGAVQNLAQTCEGFAAAMIKFCEQMDWGCVSIECTEIIPWVSLTEFQCYGCCSRSFFR